MSALSLSNRKHSNDHKGRHVSSLELSMVPSNETNELALALSQEEGDFPQSMERACQLVHSLLDQVTWNDSPPTNENPEAEFPARKASIPAFSRQCHVPPLSSVQTFNSMQSSTENCNDPSDLWKAHYHVRCNPSELKMGNVALATLCARTLETVGKSSLPTKEIDGVRSRASPTAYTKLGTIKSPRLRSQQSPNMTWRRRKSNRKKATPGAHYGEIVISRQLSIRSHDHKKCIELEDKNDNIIPPPPGRQEPVPPGNRLQMFGSEYARYLSTTVLAPRDVKISRGPTMPRANLNSRRKNMKTVHNIEDAELSTLTGPITDIVITFGENPPPNGYYRISQSAGGDRFYLRDRKAPAYINVKKETNWDRAAQRPCVTALTLIFPQRKEFVPPGFSVVRSHSSLVNTNDHNPANLSLGDEHAFLCFRRSREGNPITSILPLLPSKRESIPEGFTVLERTPRNHVASIQTQNAQVFLAYRQRLANLEPLRPLPLVMSVHKSSSTAGKLTAYYCTGGSVVDSRVGRFHILDRSTHSLLSPSSISNRLSLIEASRRKTLNSISRIPNETGNTYSYSVGNACRKPTSSNETLTSSLLLAHGLGTSASRSVVSDLERPSSVGDFESDVSLENNGPVHVFDNDVNKSLNISICSVSSATDDEGSRSHRASTVVQSLYTSADKELERCMEALSFIPVVSTAVDENDPRGMLRFQARVAVLTPILTACYTRHGGSALLAVEGLTDLLNGDFFSSDVNMEEDSSSRITLLDIVIQVVCDVATMGTQETHLQACVEFVKAGVKYGCGHLNTRTVGYVLRFYLFVFYFGVTTPSGGNVAWGNAGDRDHFLLEDPRMIGQSYLPGGAPQAAVLSLKDLVYFSVARLRSLVAMERMTFRLDTPQNEAKLLPDIFNDMIDGLVDDVIDRSVHRVDIANYTQLALHQIHRSGGSELFWYDMMNSCGSGLFGNDDTLKEETRSMYSMLFAILANCVKVASSRVRKDKHSEGVPRDTASKLMSLEMIHFFLVTWDKNMQHLEVPKSLSLETFLFAIRRLVVPCLLSNTKEALDDPRVYRRIIRILGVLWGSTKYRHHMKLEIGILLDHFVIKILRLDPQILYKHTSKDEDDMTCLFAQQIELMKALQKWFADSRGLLELFLNFDADIEGKQESGASKELLSSVHWRATEKICAALCILSEKCGEFIADQIRESQPMTNASPQKEEDTKVLEGISGTTLARESAQRLRKSALDTIAQYVRSLAESAAAVKGPKYRSLVDSWGDPPDDVHPTIPQNNSNSSSESGSNALVERQGQDAAILGFWQKAIFQKEEKEAVVKAQVVEDESNHVNHLSIAFDIGREKDLRRAIDYLIACNLLTASPRDIASFLRLHRNELKPTDLGRYLGEAGSDGSETEYWNLIRFSYIRAISFVGMTVEQGLRHLLTNGGFRLPGEAQQVDRLITTFAQCYWEDNAGDQINCPFQDQDTVFLLSFAIIMLNTDLHKSMPSTSGRKGSMKSGRKKMTKTQFIDNLKGINGRTDDLNPDYLSIIYDSIETRPIILNETADDSDASSVCSSDRLIVRLSTMAENAKSLDALLRGLSVHEYHFMTLDNFCARDGFAGDLQEGTFDLMRKVMMQTWHQFHGVINAALDIAHLDLKGMESCAEILKYALCLTICLDMPMERAAFLGQLGRYRLFNSWRRGEAKDLLHQTKTENYKNEDWYLGIEEACADMSHSSTKSKLASLKLVSELVDDLGLTIAVDVQGHKATRDAVKCLANADHLLNDPTRTFLRTGNLLKRANRSGRLVEYCFFLFSDVLIYAKKIPVNHSASNSPKYKIHEELPLILMKVVDWFPPEHKREAKKAFQIYHPRKTFLVFTSDRDERGSWVSSIRSAIDKEISRKVAIEGARKAAAKSH